jgi:hypothetical protein
VTSQYTDQQREDSFQRTQDDLNQTRSSSIQLARTRKYDIISHSGSDSFSGKTVTKRSHDHRPYHILSNMNINEHKSIHLNAEDESINRSHPPITANKPRKLGLHREFNIINNEFDKNHDDIMQNQYNHMKDHVLKKYWQTHNYDLIRGKYYDSKKEKEFRETRESLSKTHGTAKLSKLPPSIKKSEGQSYNILNCVIKNDETMRDVNINDIRASNRVLKGKEVKAKVCEKGDHLATISDLRKINRISFNRWQPELDRGYDIITADAKAKPSGDVLKTLTMPNVKKRPTEWERMTSTLTSSDINKLLASPKMSSNNHGIDQGGMPHRLHLKPDGDWKSRDLSRSMTSSRSIPSLDLSVTDFAQPVTYKEPVVNAPASQLVSIVPTPTNAASSYRNLA